MYVKIHENPREDQTPVVAICDEDLIGKKVTDGKLNLHITERFYKGEKKSEEEVIEIIKNADNLNLVGKKTIKLALENGFISEENILIIKGIPHAQIYSL
jgi:hypothetical protein